MNASLSTSLLAHQKSIARNGAKYIIAYILLLAGPHIYLDIAMPDVDSAYLLLSVVGVGLNFFLLYALLQLRNAPDEATNSRIGAFFWLSIVHNTAVTIGLVVFVLPGIYLALRWLPAFTRLLKSEDGIMEALRWSWEETSGHERDLAIPFFFVILAYLLALAPLAATDVFYGSPEYVSYETLDSLYIPITVFTNLALAIATAWYTVLGVASYPWLRSDTNPVAQEFQ